MRVERARREKKNEKNENSSFSPFTLTDRPGGNTADGLAQAAGARIVTLSGADPKLGGLQGLGGEEGRGISGGNAGVGVGAARVRATA